MDAATEMYNVLRDAVFLLCPLSLFTQKKEKNMPWRKYQLKRYLSLIQKFTIGFSQPISSLPSFKYF